MDRSVREQRRQRHSINVPSPFPCPQEASTNKIRAQNETQQRRVAAMESTFARIRQATGVNTLEEMVLKLANQSTNHATLEEEKREAESKLARAKEARQSEDTRFSYMKASGVGNTELNRDISDKLNNDIKEYRVEVRPCCCCGIFSGFPTLGNSPTVPAEIFNERNRNTPESDMIHITR